LNGYCVEEFPSACGTIEGKFGDLETAAGLELGVTHWCRNPTRMPAAK
jgi:hypothetical protein